MREFISEDDPRVIVALKDNEDGVVIESPMDMDLIQSVDFFTPIVNDPYKFGEIAAANALSDIYAMGGEPYSVMNIVCFPIKDLDVEVLRQILRGGYAKIKESGALLAGGDSVEDKEIKYGLSLTGVVKRRHIATNAGARPGDVLIITKPIGTGILATALKAKWERYEEIEEDIYRWAARLNNVGAEAIRKFGIRGATDVTGFGLGGHILEMARASKVEVELWADKIPLMDRVKELASMGLIPAGSHLNRRFCEKVIRIKKDIDPVLVDIIFDAQTSGGLILSVHPDIKEKVKSYLVERGDMAEEIGRVKILHDCCYLSIV